MSKKRKTPRLSSHFPEHCRPPFNFNRNATFQTTRRIFGQCGNTTDCFTIIQEHYGLSSVESHTFALEITGKGYWQEE